MTNDRKEELRQLLEEALDGMKIGIRLGGSSLLVPPITDRSSEATEVYIRRSSLQIHRANLRDYLQKRWKSYGIDSSSVLWELEFYFAKDKTESKLLEFIRVEMDSFLLENMDDSTYFHVYAIADDNGSSFRPNGGKSGLVHINQIKVHLLRIAITHDVEKAVATFDEGTRQIGKLGVCQDIVSLEGIIVEKEIDVFDGIRLVPLPQSTSFELERLIPGFSIKGYSWMRSLEMGQSLLIVDRPMFSTFHKSSETSEMVSVGDLASPIITNRIQFHNSDEVKSFRKIMCQTLSLACNSAVQITRDWLYFPEDDLPELLLSGGFGIYRGPFGESVKVGQSEIDEAKCLYDRLTNLKGGILEKLQIPIDRWIKSKANKSNIDKMIDLGVAFEALYVSGRNKISQQLRDNAIQYLGKDKKDQEKLRKKFKAIYDCRCDAVHEGILKEDVKVDGKIIPISEFIIEAQDLCYKTIKKILKNGKLPI